MSSSLAQYGDYKDTLVIERNETFISCPAIPGTGNMREKSCITRLQSKTIPLECRRCDRGKDAVSESLQNELCRCGNETDGIHKTCDICRMVNNLAPKRNKKVPKRRICKTCDNPTTDQASWYCEECRVANKKIADQNRRDRQNRDKKKKTLELRIKRDKAKLARLT